MRNKHTLNSISRGFQFLLLLVCLVVFGPKETKANVQLSVLGSVDSVQINSGNTFIYTLNYQVSSLTHNGINVVATIQLPDLLRPTDTINFNNSVAFDDDQVASMTYSAGLVTITFVNPIPAGSTGQLQIRMRYRNGYTPEGYAPDLVTSIDADNNINPDLSTGPVLSNIINVVSHASNRLIVGKVKTAGGAINDQAIYNISISAPGAGNGALFLFNPVVVDTLPLGMDFIEATEFSGSNPPVYNPLDRTVTWTWPTSPLNFNYSSNAYLIVEINDPPFNLGATVTNTTYLFGEVPSLPLFGLTPSTKSGSVSFLVASPTPGAACNGGNITAATANWMSKHILSGTSCNTFSNGWYNSGNTVLDEVVVEYDVDLAIDMNTIYVRPVYDGIGRASAANIAVYYQTNLNPYTLQGNYSSLAVNAMPSSRLLLPITLPSGEYITKVKFVVTGVLPIGGSQNFNYCGDARTSAQGKKDGSPIVEGITYNTSNVGDDGTVVFNNSTGSFTYLGSTTMYSGCNGSAEIMIPQPVFGFTSKTITNSSTNFRASDTIDYKFQTYLGGNVLAQDVFISDTLDNRLTYINGSSEFCIDNSCSPITPIISGNILTWNIVPPPLAVGKNYAIKFKAEVKPGTLAGTIPNRAVLGSSNALFNTVTPNVNATVITSVALRAFKGQSGCDGNFLYYPNFAVAQEGGNVKYKITIKNLGNIASKDLVLIDVFPFIGDNRGSQWFANMVSPGTVSDPNATVYYTTTTNPCLSDLVPPINPGGCSAPVWTSTPPVDITSVKAIKITRALPMAPLDSIELSWNMKAPLGTPIGLFMNNSISFQAKRNDNSSQLLPATPNMVGMYTNCLPVLGSIGNYAWIDINKNGINDEPATNGLNGVKVYLYGAGPNNAIGGGDDILLDSTVTANDFFGNKGYYKFVELATGYYYVVFQTFYNQHKLSAVSNQHPQTDNNNDANQSTGLSGLVYIDAAGLGQDKHNTTIDAGYFPIGTIGNYVWYDRNGDGLQNEPPSSGLNGVWVYLYKFNGSIYVKVDSVQTANKNGNPGYYEFIIEDNGTYKVGFPLSVGNPLTQKTSGSNSDGNSDADPISGLSDAIVMNVSGSGLAKNNPTIDAGYLCTDVVADFNITQTGCCGEVEVENLSQFGNNFEWKFENDNGYYFYECDDSADVFSTSLYPGNYTVRLIAKNDICNTVDTMIKTLTIKPRANAIFAHVLDSCSLTATFINYSFHANSYAWNFGDPGSGPANISSLPSPLHTFSAPGTYQVRLVVGNGTSCYDTLVKSITVQPASGIVPAASYTYTTLAGCTQKFLFTNTSTSAVSIKWIFADGTNGNQNTISKTLPDAGNIPVSLVAYSATGCTDTFTQNLLIASNASGPLANFSVDLEVQCRNGNSFNFSNSSTYKGIGWINQYYWDFGDGSFDHSNAFVFNKVYANPGTYQVRLVAKSAWSTCTDTAYRLIVVKPSPNTGFVTGNYCGREIAFYDTSTSASPILGRDWSFGDGAKPCLQDDTLIHTFCKPGWFTNKLTVVSENGCIDSVMHFANPINDSMPIASFTYDTVHCANAIAFRNTSTGGAFTWNFGNNLGYSYEHEPIYSYPAAGVYNVVLKVSKGLGCFAYDTVTVKAPAGFGNAVPRGKFDYEIEPCTNTITAYSLSTNATVHSWIFDGVVVGSGTWVTIPNGTVGWHVLKLAVANGPCYDTIFKHIYFMEPPIPEFEFTLSNCANTAYFTSKSKYATQFTWHFDDSASLTNIAYGTQASHAFSANGTYQVKLVVANSQGCKDSLTLPVTVNKGSNPNQARFGFENAVCQNCFCNNQVVFRNLTLGNNNAYLWNFGDGSTSVDKNPTKGYGAAGTYLVTLTSSDSLGCLSSVSKQVTITSESSGPSASFTTDHFVQCVNTNRFNFYNTSTYMGNGWIPKYYWDFGDGTWDTTNSNVFGKVYAAPGAYKVRMVALGTDYCKDTASIRVFVVALPCAGVLYYGNPNQDVFGQFLDFGMVPATGLKTTEAKANNGLLVYPNPNNGSFQVKLQVPLNGQVSVKVIDLLGRETYSKEVNARMFYGLSIDDASLAPGTYYVVVTDKNGNSMKEKLVVIE